MATSDDTGGPRDPDDPGHRENPDDPGNSGPYGRTREQLLTRWSELLVAARDGDSGPDPVPYGENLLSRWSEPHRRYHHLGHLVNVLDRIEELAPHCPGADVHTVLLAAWFHDAVYRPDRSENEERSAHLAERALPEAGISADRTAGTARLVRLTVSHDPAPDDIDGQLLCDADLAVLAGTPADYARYAAAVRQEYAFVPDDRFREGRTGVLRELLGMPRLYRTPYARERWEATARRNMETEMELLVTGD